MQAEQDPIGLKIFQAPYEAGMNNRIAISFIVHPISTVLFCLPICFVLCLSPFSGFGLRKDFYVLYMALLHS